MPRRTAHSDPVSVESPLLSQLDVHENESECATGAPVATPVSVADAVRFDGEFASGALLKLPGVVRFRVPLLTLAGDVDPLTAEALAVEVPVSPKKGRSQPSPLSRLMVKAPLSDDWTVRVYSAPCAQTTSKLIEYAEGNVAEMPPPPVGTASQSVATLVWKRVLNVVSA